MEFTINGKNSSVNKQRLIDYVKRQSSVIFIEGTEMLERKGWSGMETARANSSRVGATPLIPDLG